LTGNAGWLELIEEFRALGGVAENICLGNGERGRGLFPCDPSRPVRLRVPGNLLLPIEDVEFVNNRFCVAASSKMGVAERKWVEHYANEYTWGAGGRAETETFLAEILVLPDHIRETLIKSFGMTFCRSNHSPASVQERFLDSRIITYGGRRVVMPLVELVNHDGVWRDMIVQMVSRSVASSTLRSWWTTARRIHSKYFWCGDLRPKQKRQ